MFKTELGIPYYPSATPTATNKFMKFYIYEFRDSNKASIKILIKGISGGTAY